MVAPVPKTQAHIFNIASYRDRYLHYDTSEYVNNVKDFGSAFNRQYDFNYVA